MQYKLAGVDTVISTITGQAQLRLIDAAMTTQVRRFMPSEFEGSPSARPMPDPLDYGRRAALSRLQQYSSQGMSYTVFTCGLFYERFGPGGIAASQIGLSTGIAGEGQYLMDFKNLRAQIPLYNSLGRDVYVCMTSARDVARFIVAALDLPSWPRELRLRGERLKVSQIVAIGEMLRGGKFLFISRGVVVVSALADVACLKGQPFDVAHYASESLGDELMYARATSDALREKRLQHLIATAEGRYDFAGVPNLNQAVATQPKKFREWMIEAWTGGGS